MAVESGLTAFHIEFSYKHITTNDTFSIQTGKTYLHVIVVNDAGTSWVITIYDSSGSTTDISSNVVAKIPAAQGTFGYNATLNNGLRVVTSGTTPGDLTVVYK